MALQIVRRATAKWSGSDSAGTGSISLGSGAFTGPYSLKSRIDDVPQSNPEELIGAALAGCFAMALSSELAGAGHEPTSLEVNAKVKMVEEPGRFSITLIQLEVNGVVPGLDEEEFFGFADATKSACPVSRALAGTSIELQRGSYSNG
ncbi:MAG: OsmC family peroxiredoxin [Candidatus Leucobacter sulfamidivorax]|nr:OsmC family peroxiredoxin [Candidatus Leucobacter sulfamidivorax]